MDESWEKWLSDLEKVEWHLFNEHNNMKMNMNSLEEELKGENPVKPELCLETLPCASPNIANSSTLEEKTQQHLSSNKPNLSSNVTTFEDSINKVPNDVPKRTFPCNVEHEHLKENQEEETNCRKPKRGRSSSQTLVHIIAERKRRENLTKLFIALSAIIPGLKKVSSK
ncbi:hypothetical protein VNO78_26205 [Psophocarpus tetragonolobus]|uniref:BHLH domain-containing protein n=1 Tax=Psophocarpus tetragonolobus TaxID=3891 RepID=A0AAN9X890_PSOTE